MSTADAPVTRAVLSLGSNLGDRRAHLAAALATLTARVTVDAVSSVYRTPPWGPVPQGDYYNLTVAARAELDPYGWLALCRELERNAGRVRDIRWGPRTLDADVVMVDEVVSVDPDLTLPHPRAHERAFVLLPWMEIEPFAQIPGHGPIGDLLADLATAEITVVGRVS
ncbi:2-amino-4-hydroxy-6-hydroxymethyldihydropteridinediphosphokinase [Nakamurella panacisegetis]|uniref:2-amino-4-hydroxy-6-hydroxymethyldihydropteridine diphosphokinase n=1 Tax=Nakamurella panacisegetis TaxID=1090615 RepID=A0A1H0NP45_9ACTN|nr:2-amino-4-hydroxy-6-hydroxymethyldihydropteridine diphosphokinase [Nakamurella panacisegetis]SDO94411.1 2-amino-4-hydroxy-6-hydroxymethyldihydropteridinediphosphokinase [Nakamurella panacisegetis]